mgnify:CR=1 FL=1
MAEDKNPTDEPNPDIALEEALAEELDERDLEIARLREEAAQYKDRLLRTAAEVLDGIRALQSKINRETHDPILDRGEKKNPLFRIFSK